MGYMQMDVIVEGALDISEIYFDDQVALMDSDLESLAREALKDGWTGEVFMLYHGHDVDVDECACVQYVTDHHPTHVIGGGS